MERHSSEYLNRSVARPGMNQDIKGLSSLLIIACQIGLPIKTLTCLELLC